MRHSVYGSHLGRDTNQRTALFRGLVRSLFLNDSIETTQTKAKAIKGLVDRLISKSIDGSSASRRVVEAMIPQKEVLKKLREEIAPRYTNRKSGFTQTVRLGRRLGDNSLMVRISLFKADQGSKKVSQEKIIEEPQAEVPALEAVALEGQDQPKAEAPKQAKETKKTSKKEKK